MPMGIVSEEDFIVEQGRLEHSIVPTVEIKDINIGRGKGSTEIPNEVRKIIGEVGVVDRQGAIAIAASVGISPSSASAYRVGSTSTSSYNDPTKSLGGHVDRVRNRIVKKAKNRLIEALDAITEGKLADAKLSEVSGVARDMSVIVKNMEPEVPKDKGNINNNFILYRPMMKTEDSFETIYSKE